jgi:hypothetical protein
VLAAAKIARERVLWLLELELSGEEELDDEGDVEK